MKIKKNSLIDVVVKVIMVVSFALMFGEPKFNLIGIGFYVMNIMIFWFMLTIEEYYVVEGRK